METDTAEQVTVEQDQSEKKASGKGSPEQKSAQLWVHTVRGLYVLLFWVILRISEFVVAGVAILTFGFKLVTGKAQPKVLSFGDSLSTYIYQVVSFMTYKSETKPFPFQEWPISEIISDAVEQEENVVEVAEIVEAVAEKVEAQQGKANENAAENVQPPPGKQPDPVQPTA